jgi:hypothetical protein
MTDPWSRAHAAIDEQIRAEHADMSRVEFEQILRDYLSVFASAEGGRVLADLKRVFFDASTHVPGDPVASHARSAQRDVILRIVRMRQWAANR